MSAKVGMKHIAKFCMGCHIEFTPTGNNTKFCPACATFRLMWSRKVSTKPTGAGSGGANIGQATVHNYRYFYLTRLYINQRGLCKHCLDSFPESILIVHHKDGDRYNNTTSNLELVCKQCHQIEHECWKAFKKA